MQGRLYHGHIWESSALSQPLPRARWACLLNPYNSSSLLMTRRLKYRRLCTGHVRTSCLTSSRDIPEALGPSRSRAARRICRRTVNRRTFAYGSARAAPRELMSTYGPDRAQWKAASPGGGTRGSGGRSVQSYHACGRTCFSLAISHPRTKRFGTRRAQRAICTADRLNPWGKAAR